MRKHSGWMMALVLTLTGTVLLGHDAYMGTKAMAASRLIDAAWQRTCLDGQKHTPWQWADFSPIGKIEVPGQGVMQAVLSDASGQSMAFGLGHVPGTAQPGSPGNIVLGGHRDSHAEFLAHLTPGDSVILHDTSGATRYVITHSEVVSADDTRVLNQDGPDRLTLVTCFPFGGLAPTDKRYVLTGLRAPQLPVEQDETMPLAMSF